MVARPLSSLSGGLPITAQDLRAARETLRGIVAATPCVSSSTLSDVTGAAELEEGVEMVMPGDNTKMKIRLIQPVAMEEGLRFAVREGGRTVGAGVITKVLE